MKPPFEPTAPEVRAERLQAPADIRGSAISRRRVVAWAIAVLAIVTLLAVRDAVPGWHPIAGDTTGRMALGLFLAALVCEFVDSSLGMGYGTILTPLLLLFGFEPLQVVPAILFSECLTGFAAGLFHHRDGNVDFLRDRRARGTALWLGSLSVVGTLAAVTLALSVPGVWLKVIIAVILLSVGVMILSTIRRQLTYRRGHIIGIGALAAFNKAISGGGYGPLVTGGQVVSGVSPKQAVAITSLSEGLTCFVGLLAYAAMGRMFDWSVAVPLALGALLSVPMATGTVRRLPESLMRGSVGVVTCALGLLMVLKLVL